jgi:hypothetical protein
MKPRNLLFSTILYLGLSMPSTALPASIEGRVINHETTAGIEGAFVYVRWIHHGSDGLGSRTSCAQMTVVTTDANGAYSFPSGPWGTDPSIQVYKPGFEDLVNLVTDAPGGGEIHRLVPLSSPSKREDDFVAIRALVLCRIPRVAEVLTPLYQAADDDAAKLGLRGNFMRSLRFLSDVPADTKKGAR